MEIARQIVRPTGPFGFMACLDGQVTLIGRDGVVAELARKRARLTLVTGDSGIGKSAVLGRAAELTAHGDAPLPPQLALGHDGSLQTCVLYGLCEVLSASAREDSARVRASEVLGRVATRVAKASGREMGKIVLEAASGYLTSKFGEPVGSAVQGVIQEVASGKDATLRRRLQSATDRDALDALCAFADEVAGSVGDVVLYLDRAERLTDSDFSALLDLSEQLPEPVRLVAAISDSDAPQAARVRTARRQGVPVIAIQPLALDSIESWLAAEEIETDLASTVLRFTNGYPLFIQAAIDYLKQGRSLEGVPITDGFRAITEDSWLALSTEARACAVLLAGLEDPPDGDERDAIIPMPHNTWIAIRAELQDARLFIPQVAGVGEPWFHDRRRSTIWNDILGPRDRERAAVQIVEALRNLVERQGLHGPSTVLAIARLFPLALGAIDSHPALGQLDSLSDGGLALLASILELSLEQEGDDGIRFVDLPLVIAHAHRNFRGEFDALNAAEEIRGTDLVYVASDESRTIVTITVPDALTGAAMYGRILGRFGRAPVRGAASMVFEYELKPLLGRFTMCSYGNGEPGVASSYQELAKPDPLPDPPGLYWAGSYGARRLHMTATFPTIEDRDRAVARLEVIERDMLEESIRSDFVLQLPARAIPPLRFVNALAEISSEAFPGRVVAHARPPGESHSVREIAAALVSVHEAVRDRYTQIERVASGTRNHLAVAFAEGSDGSYRIAHIATDAPRVVEVRSDEMSGFRDPLSSLSLLRAARLPMDSFVKEHQWSNGKSEADPTAQALGRYAKNIEQYNSCAEPMVLEDLDQAKEALRSALIQRFDDAEYLLNSGVLVRKGKPLRRRSYFIVLARRESNLWPGRQGLFYEFKAIESDVAALEIVTLEPGPSAVLDDWGALVDHAYGRRARADGSIGQGESDGILANLLGFPEYGSKVRFSFLRDLFD